MKFRKQSNFAIVLAAAALVAACSAKQSSFTPALGAPGNARPARRRPAPSPGASSTPRGTATPLPTPTPTVTPPGSNQETYEGINVFDAGNAYTAGFSATPIDPNSASVIANQGGLALNASYGFSAGVPIQTINLANGGTPSWNVATTSSHNPAIYVPPVTATSGNPVPWGAGGGGFAYEVCCSDAHGNVMDTAAHYEYEMYQVRNAGTSSMAAYLGVRWNLNAPLASQYGQAPGATASNLPYIAGALISDRDCCATSANENTFINHALAFLYPTVNAGAHTSSWGYLRPASWPVYGSAGNCQSNCASTSLYYGEHLRLHSTSSLPPALGACIGNGSCPQAASIVYALQTYGMYFEDQSTSTFGLVFFANHNTVSASNWNTADLSNLDALHITDFDVLQRGTIHCYGASAPC